MRVTVRLYASLRDLAPAGPGEAEIELPAGTTVADLVARLGIPAGMVRKAFVSGIARDESYVLQPGEEVGLFPPIAGGA
jgi:molybdopterin converting factor small subunit